jgi:hypothetical protein
MSTAAMSTPRGSRSKAATDRTDVCSESPRAGTCAGHGRSEVKPWERLAAAIWDHQFLRVQLIVYRAVPRFAARLDELARRRDEERRSPS